MSIEIFKTDSLQLLTLGGVATANTTTASKILNKKIHGKERNVILLSSHMENAISSRLIRAMLFHEEGHIFHQHYIQYNKNSIKNQQGLIIFNSKLAELEADSYAAMHVSAQMVIRALKAIITYIDTCAPIIEKLSSTMPLDEAKTQANIYSKNLSNTLAYRIEALEKSL